MAQSPIILAVDTSDFDTARAWIDATRESIDIYKLGLEFFLTFGCEGIESIARESGASIFLDLKLHDIPHTVSKAAAVVQSLRPRFLTVHASGGEAMVAAAVQAVTSTSITAVTILTSLSEDDLAEIGFRGTALSTAQSLATLAVKAGATSIVCSPHEISGIRQSVGDSVTIITPGVRPADEKSGDDQKRVMDPSEAISLGADFLVIGRPITSRWVDGAETMASRAAQIRDSIQR
jgi:orotidine-5'-phosphate decarboxylase